jgi:hypothetical protein
MGKILPSAQFFPSNSSFFAPAAVLGSSDAARERLVA